MVSLNIPDSSRVYVDTSIIIYTVEKFPKYVNLLTPLWTKLIDSKIEVITSELTLLEVLVQPMKKADDFFINVYEQLLESSEIQLIPINKSMLKKAANLRAKTSLKTPDSIHAATFFLTNCDLFLTNDLIFRNIPELTGIILGDLIS